MNDALLRLREKWNDLTRRLAAWARKALDATRSRATASASTPAAEAAAAHADDASEESGPLSADLDNDASIEVN